MSGERLDEEGIQWLMAFVIVIVTVIPVALWGLPALIVAGFAYGLVRFVWWTLASNRGLHRRSRK